MTGEATPSRGEATPPVVMPVVAIVGRPNVGKSTLFNALTRSREALVADQPGVTRDRLVGLGKIGDQPFIVIDTGGLSDEADAMTRQVLAQAMRAIEDADVVIAVVDGRAGYNAGDEQIAQWLRRADTPIVLAVNKTEHLELGVAVAEFHTLGLGEPVGISAAHRRGIGRLVDAALALAEPQPLPAMILPGSLPGSRGKQSGAPAKAGDGKQSGAPAKAGDGKQSGAPAKAGDGEPPLRIAIVGRPNVGKSTLVNRLAGEQRVVAHDAPGTTRDAIAVPIERRGKPYVLIDTAGVRRRARISESLEKLTVVKSLQSVGAAQVVVLMLDATAGVTEQDLTLLGHVLESGSALAIAVNKWDALDRSERALVHKELDRRLVFAPYARVCTLSALEGSGIGALFGAIQRAWASATIKLSSSDLTRRLAAAVEANPPPLARGRRIKLRYAHQGGGAPPIIIIHGNQTDSVPESYRRYLTNYYRREMSLEGTPLRIEFRTGDNPFKGRRNKLTLRQERKRKRLLKHYKR